MKKTILAIVMALTCNTMFAQDALFKKYDNVKGVSTVYISKALLSLIPEMHTGNKDISKIAGKLDHAKILSCELPSLVEEITSETIKYFKSGEYTNLMKMNDGDGGQTIIYGKSIDKEKSEFVLFSNMEDEVNIINVMGTITLNDIKQITNKPN